jgi:hypothetical protein
MEYLAYSYIKPEDDLVYYVLFKALSWGSPDLTSGAQHILKNGYLGTPIDLGTDLNKIGKSGATLLTKVVLDFTNDPLGCRLALLEIPKGTFSATVSEVTIQQDELVLEDIF